MASLSHSADSMSPDQTQLSRRTLTALEAVFATSLFFQLTVLPTTLDLSFVGRIVNAAILLFFAVLTGITFGRKQPAVFNYYYAPVVLILIGFSINLMRSLGQSSIGYFSILLPWLAAASVPFVRSLDFERIWRIYFWFMLIVAVDALVEYVLVFKGLLPVRRAGLTQGDFLVSIFSVFHELEGEYFPHERLYGVFLEPGTAAMFALPALSFALVCRRYLVAGLLLVFIYLTESLGGYAAAGLLVGTFLLWKIGAFLRPSRLVIVTLVVVVPCATYATTHYLVPKFEARGESAEIRQENVTAFAANFGRAIVQNPLGIGLRGDTLTELDVNRTYFGSNFMVYVAFVEGGVLALVGYLTLLLVSIYMAMVFFLRYRAQASPTVVCAFISLPPMLSFVPQRGTIFECVLFAFMFAPPIVAMLQDAPAPVQDESAP